MKPKERKRSLDRENQEIQLDEYEKGEEDEEEGGERGNKDSVYDGCQRFNVNISNIRSMNIGLVQKNW